MVQNSQTEVRTMAKSTKSGSKKKGKGGKGGC